MVVSSPVPTPGSQSVHLVAMTMSSRRRECQGCRTGLCINVLDEATTRGLVAASVQLRLLSQLFLFNGVRILSCRVGDASGTVVSAAVWRRKAEREDGARVEGWSDRSECLGHCQYTAKEHCMGRSLTHRTPQRQWHLKGNGTAKALTLQRQGYCKGKDIAKAKTLQRQRLWMVMV